MDNIETRFWFILTIIITLLILCCGIMWGRKIEKCSAIKAGYGKYVCNEKTGKLIFIYKNNTNE